MPTTLTGSGVTFNDNSVQTTSALAANAIGTSQIANNAVTAAKLGANEQKQICKSWVNFNGTIGDITTFAIPSTDTFSCVAGGNTLTWTKTSASFTNNTTQSFAFVILGSSTFGGANVSNMQVAANYTSSTFITLTLPAGQTFSSTITNQSASTTSTGRLLGLIRSSHNVSSITKNGTGDYTVNFATAMADANYSTNVSGGQATYVYSDLSFQSALQLTTSVRVVVAADPTSTGNGLMYDPTTVSLQVFGN